MLRILRGHRRRAERERRSFDGVSCAAIQADLLTPVPDVTRLLDRLCRDGLADRQRSPKDRRIVLSRITEKGMRLLEALDEPLLALHASQFGHLQRAELRNLIELLTKARGPHAPARPPASGSTGAHGQAGGA